MTHLVQRLVMVFFAAAIVATADAQTPKPSAVADANAITAADLAKLPHMNADLAKMVIAKRPFKTVTDLDAALSSLTREQRTELYGKVFVRINLNTATDDQILLIPGMGKRMLHEFKEYRPYTSIAQFRREIGKYVNEAEVARFEQYVFVPQQK